MSTNDLFENREGISPSTFSWTVPQVPSFLEAWEAPVVPRGGAGSIWWIWRAPRSGWVTYRAASTGSAVSVGAFVGQKLQLLEPTSPAGSLDTHSETRFFAEEGSTYTLALFGAPPWSGEAKVELIYETVNLLSPASLATLPWGSEIPLVASLDVEAETAISMEFYANSERVGSRTEPPWILPWRPAVPGSFSLRVEARTSSGKLLTSERVPTLVHSGGDAPVPRLVSAPELNGTVVMDGMGNVHLLGMPRGLFGITHAPIHGLPETASWPPGVARWTDLAVSSGGFGAAWMGALDPEGNLYVSPRIRVPFPEGVEKFVKLCRGFNSVFAIGDDGHAYHFGVTRYESAATRPWRHFSHGYGFSAGLDDRGVLVLFTQGTFGEQVLQEAQFPPGVSSWERIEVSAGVIIAMDRAHQLYEVPTGSLFGLASSQRMIVRPDGGSDWSDFSIGGTVGLALAPDGRLFSWGSNQEGQLGNNGPSSSVTSLGEVRMPDGVTAWVTMVAGESHGMAVGNDGELYRWGWFDGGLGIIPGAIRSGPMKVSPLPEIAGPTRAFAHREGMVPELAVPTLPKRKYWIQVSDGLSPWTTLPDPVLGTGSTVLWRDPVPLAEGPAGVGSTTRLYRVGRLP